MLPTNQYFHTQLRLVDARLRQLQGYRNARGRAAALQQLREEQEFLKLVLLNRRVEAARQVVDLERWRTANGAVRLVDEDQGKRRRAG
jgi:hypothetical protein